MAKYLGAWSWNAMYKKYTVPSCKRVTLNNKKRNTKLVVVHKEKILNAQYGLGV